MRNRGYGAMITAMQASGPRVTIEFEAGASEHMSGRLLGEDGTASPFDGWLGLAGILERLLVPADEPEAATPGRNETPS